MQEHNATRDEIRRLVSSVCLGVVPGLDASPQSETERWFLYRKLFMDELCTALAQRAVGSRPSELSDGVKGEEQVRVEGQQQGAADAVREVLGEEGGIQE
ncbi:MAG: hypothetical protein AAB728_05090, partial [Patescibacteria group bacterium]